MNKEMTGEMLFKKYAQDLKEFSDGKYTATEEDFVKFYSFFNSVTYPTIVQFAEAISGMEIKSE